VFILDHNPSGLVVEDAPSGLQSGRDAGATTLAVCTSHSREDLSKLGPDYIVANLTQCVNHILRPLNLFDSIFDKGSKFDGLPID
jgi:phosphoglycolate phosphatase-like HAD superfamily hydrolase